MFRRTVSSIIVVILASLVWRFLTPSQLAPSVNQKNQAYPAWVSSDEGATPDSTNGNFHVAENQFTDKAEESGDCYTSSAIVEKFKKIDVSRKAMMSFPSLPKTNRETYSSYNIKSLKKLVEQGDVYAMFELAHIYSVEYSRKRFALTSPPMRNDIDLFDVEELQSTSRELFIRAAENGLNEAVSGILLVLPSCITCNFEDQSVKDKYLEHLKWEILNKSRGITVVLAEPTDSPQPRWVFPRDFERTNSTKVKEELIVELEALLKDLNLKRKANNVAPYLLGREILDYAGVSLILNERCKSSER